MKVAAVFKFQSPFEVWNPVISAQGTTYVKARDDLGRLLAGTGSTYLTAKTAMPVGTLVRNVLDTKGNPVFNVNGEHYDMYVNEFVPQFDTFGAVIAWKHTLKRELPKDYTKTILAAIEAAAN